ncbi:MAG TPA: hypothetical protein P5096_01760 [Patescibacteria group bacterium]|nr:hypothetical protein [Patescibacteria group bacterium]
MKKYAMLAVAVLMVFFALVQSAKAEKMILIGQNYGADVTPLIEPAGYSLTSERWSSTCMKEKPKHISGSQFEIVGFKLKCGTLCTCSSEGFLEAYDNGLTTDLGGDLGYIISVPAGKGKYDYYAIFRNGDDSDSQSAVREEDQTEEEAPPAPPEKTPENTTAAALNQTDVKTEYLVFGMESEDVNKVLKMFNFDICSSGWQKVCVLKGYPKESGKTSEGKTQYEVRYVERDCNSAQSKKAFFTCFTYQGQDAGVTISIETGKPGIYGLYGRINPDLKKNTADNTESKAPAENQASAAKTVSSAKTMATIERVESSDGESEGGGIPLKLSGNDSEESETSSKDLPKSLLIAKVPEAKRELIVESEKKQETKPVSAPECNATSRMSVSCSDVLISLLDKKEMKEAMEFAAAQKKDAIMVYQTLAGNRRVLGVMTQEDKKLYHFFGDFGPEDVLNLECTFSLNEVRLAILKIKGEKLSEKNEIGIYFSYKVTEESSVSSEVIEHIEKASGPLVKLNFTDTDGIVLDIARGKKSDKTFSVPICNIYDVRSKNEADTNVILDLYDNAACAPMKTKKGEKISAE